MDMVISFPGGARVDADLGSFAIHTDQPPEQGGEGSAPTPFTLFLASIGACAGVYALSFCRQRDIPTDGIRLIQRSYSDPITGLVAGIHLEFELPESFPEKYRAALVRAAEQCTVKKHLEHPPRFAWTTRVVRDPARCVRRPAARDGAPATEPTTTEHGGPALPRRPR